MDKLKIKVLRFFENWKFIKSGRSVYATKEFVLFINKPYKAKVQAEMNQLTTKRRFVYPGSFRDERIWSWVPEFLTGIIKDGSERER